MNIASQPEQEEERFDTVLLITRPPYQGRRSEEMLEAIMSLALFDRNHAVIFFDRGLAWLAGGQSPTDRKNLSKQISALPMYGSEALFYCLEHRDRITGAQPIHENVRPCSNQRLALWLRRARYVEVF